jgi:multimeric flavodoxin WrbA
MEKNKMLLKDILNEDKKYKDINIILIQGSARDSNTCPSQNGKTKNMLTDVKKYLKSKNVKVDVLDLSVKGDGNIVQPCKGCISSAGGFQCHWPCSCYSKNDDLKDYMHNEDVYMKLQKCNGFMVLTPVNWDSVSGVVKNFFDRLVCANLTLTVEESRNLTNDDIKNLNKNRNLLKSNKYNHLLKNHLENKFGAFFIHGDAGAADYKIFAKNKSDGKDVPPSILKNEFEVDNKFCGYSDIKQCIMPIVNQCIYSGIFVKKNCVDGIYWNKGINYADANDNNVREIKSRYIKVADNLLNAIYKNK